MAAKVSRIEREDRTAAKAAVTRLREALREARHRHKQAMFEARERCRSERLAVRERTRALRLQVLAELRATTRTERQAARDACTLRLREARSLRQDEARARATFSAERKFQHDLRASERAHKSRAKEAPATCGGCRHESDDDVLANLPSDLAMVYDRVKEKLPKAKPANQAGRGGGGGGKYKTKASKIEAFLAYAEKHPEQILEATQAPAYLELKALEAEHAEAKKRLNPFEERKARRIERMKQRADRLKGESEAARTQAQRIADVIPLGQPILSGHHSERRHRRDIARIDKGHKKAFALHREAESLERRARYAESNRAISSDDPDAVLKLRAKLADLEKSHERMVLANKLLRGPDPRAALAREGFSEKIIASVMTPNFMGRSGFPGFALQNSGHEIARVKKRIEVIEARAVAPAKPAIVGPGVRIEEAENRVRILFDAKPAMDMRSALKGNGFRWAPSIGAWQKHASWSAWEDAKRITKASTAEAPAALPVTTPEPRSRETAPPNPPRVFPSDETPHAAAERRRVPGDAEGARQKELAKKHDASVTAAKGESRLDTTDIAALIRKDIKAAVSRGDLPKGHYSVVTDKYSMGSSITVTASKMPFPVLNPDAFVVLGDANYTQLDSRHRTRMTPRADAVHDKLQAIVDAYHWDKSDHMSDVYNERFSRSVSVESAPGEYQAIEKAKVEEARRRRGD